LTLRPQTLATDPKIRPALVQGAECGTGLFFVEHILHPGSRRRAWRAEGQDELVAAASLLPHIDRATLSAALGRGAVEAKWPVLVDLAGSRSSGDRPGLPPRLRSALARATRMQRPWLAERWCDRMRAHLVERADRPAPDHDPAEDWLAFAATSWDARWHAELHREEEQRGVWTVRRGCAVAEGSAGWFLSVADARGRCLGAMSLAPAAPRGPCQRETARPPAVRALGC
jgi:hypothetical protein